MPKVSYSIAKLYPVQWQGDSAFFCSNFRSRIPKRLLPFQLRRSCRSIGLRLFSFKHKIDGVGNESH
jgi:hypothetical protein